MGDHIFVHEIAHVLARGPVAQSHALSIHTDSRGSPVTVVVLKRNEATDGLLV